MEGFADLKKPDPGVERQEVPDECLIAKAKAGCQGGCLVLSKRERRANARPRGSHGVLDTKAL